MKLYIILRFARNAEDAVFLSSERFWVTGECFFCNRL